MQPLTQYPADHQSKDKHQGDRQASKLRIQILKKKSIQQSNHYGMMKQINSKRISIQAQP